MECMRLNVHMLYEVCGEGEMLSLSAFKRSESTFE